MVSLPEGGAALGRRAAVQGGLLPGCSLSNRPRGVAKIKTVPVPWKSVEVKLMKTAGAGRPKQQP